jgi:amino acid transporter
VAAATYTALGFLTLFYAVTAWAMTVAVGPDAVAGSATDGFVPVGWMDQVVGLPIHLLWTFLLVVGMVVALLSFHNVVARQVYALSREDVLPGSLSAVRVGSAGGAPWGGSLLQSGVALGAIAVVVVSGVRPIVMFTWLSTIASVGVLVLLVGCSAAALGFFHRNPALTRRPVAHLAGGDRPRRLGWWAGFWAPLLGVGGGGSVLIAMIRYGDTLLGVAPGSPLTLLPLAVVLVAAVVGAWWGLRLRAQAGAVYARIGRGRPHPIAVLDHGMPEV